MLIARTTVQSARFQNWHACPPAKWPVKPGAWSSHSTDGACAMTSLRFTINLVADCAYSTDARVIFDALLRQLPALQPQRIDHHTHRVQRHCHQRIAVPLDSVRNSEQGKRCPTGAALVALHCIPSVLLHIGQWPILVPRISNGTKAKARAALHSVGLTSPTLPGRFLIPTGL